MENKDRDEALIPYFMVESLMEIHRRQIFQVILVFAISIVIMVIGFIYAWTSYDYESSETSTTTTTVQQDGSGVNVYGDENEVKNGSESDSNPYQNEN